MSNPEPSTDFTMKEGYSRLAEAAYQASIHMGDWVYDSQAPTGYAAGALVRLREELDVSTRVLNSNEAEAMVGSASGPAILVAEDETASATEKMREAYLYLAEIVESLGERVYQGEVNEALKHAAIKAGIDHTREPTWVIERLGERVELLRSDLAKAEKAIASYRSYAQSGLELLASDGEGY